MAISEAYEGSSAIGATEFSCPNNSTTLTPITVDGVYQFDFDLSDMVVGDQLHIKIKEKVRSSGTQRVYHEAILTGVMAPTKIFPSLILMHGWDVTLQALSGTITVEWSIRKVG